MKEPVRILFVCYGNICRSPMAEFVTKRLVRDARLEARFEIASAATSREELGNSVDPRARAELARHGIPCGGHAARQMTAADGEYYDWLIGMERSNLRDMRRICGGAGEKLRLLMSFAGSEAEIDDPWYTGRFAEVYGQIETGCRALLNALLTES